MTSTPPPPSTTPTQHQQQIIPCSNFTTQTSCASTLFEQSNRCMWNCLKNGQCSCVGRPSAEEEDAKLIIGVLSVIGFLVFIALVIVLYYKIRKCQNEYYEVNGKRRSYDSSRLPESAHSVNNGCSAFCSRVCCCCGDGSSSSLKGGMVSEGVREGTFGKAAQTSGGGSVARGPAGGGYYYHNNSRKSPPLHPTSSSYPLSHLTATLNIHDGEYNSRRSSAERSGLANQLRKEDSSNPLGML